MNQLKKENTIKRVQNVEHGVFTPLVFTTTGSMGKEGTTFYKRLADMLSRKQEKPYSVVMGWLRCRLTFALLRSAILCIRGTRSSFNHPVDKQNLTLASVEGQIVAQWEQPPPLECVVLCICFYFDVFIYFFFILRCSTCIEKNHSNFYLKKTYTYHIYSVYIRKTWWSINRSCT